MAGTLQTLQILTSPVTGISTSQSRNHKLKLPQLIFSGNISVTANTSNTLIPRKLRSLTGTIVIRNCTNSDQFQGNDGPNEAGKRIGPSNLSVSAGPLLNFIGSNFLPLVMFMWNVI
ncbi:putative sodium bile acid cotransporter [Helianthus annuus]|nr:putative sodium bile acid cotransporter [Helianthus annuus]